MKAALNIPAINNQKCVLAQHLGIDSDDPSIEDKITQGDIHYYQVTGTLYAVAHASKQLAVNGLHFFNASWWSVLPIDDEQPYVRFKDEKVIEQLRSVSPSGFHVRAINQKEHRVLFQNDAGDFSIWVYTAHMPDDIASYHIRGRTGEPLSHIKEIFGFCAE